MTIVPDEIGYDNPDAAGVFNNAPERSFVQALRHGFDWLRQNPDALNRIMPQSDELELRQIKSVFEPGGKAYPGIWRGYPMITEGLPQIGVFIGSETQSRDQEILGDMVAIERDIFELDDVGEHQSNIRTVQLECRIVSDHPNLTLLLHRIADYILLAHKSWFEGEGISNPRFVRAAEVEVIAKTPERLWGREIVWEGEITTGAVIGGSGIFSGFVLALSHLTVNGIQGGVVAHGGEED